MSHNKEDFILEAIKNNDVGTIKTFTSNQLNDVRIQCDIYSPSCYS